MRIKDQIRHFLHYAISSFHYRLIQETELHRREETKLPGLQSDYVRRAAAQLAAIEIYSKDLQGDVAELGVYRGDFAQTINLLFPDRILYLFDTFEGFDRKDLTLEKDKNYSDKSNHLKFCDTNIEIVMQKMAHPQNVRPVKGYFPDSVTPPRKHAS